MCNKFIVYTFVQQFNLKVMLINENIQDYSYRTILIDLAEMESVPFGLTGLAWSLGKQIGMSLGEITDLVAEMTSNGYYNMIDVFEKNFSDLVLITNKKIEHEYNF